MGQVMRATATFFAVFLAACASDPIGAPTRRPAPGPAADPDGHDSADSGRPPAPDAGLEECASATVEATSTVRPVDIVWVIDSSGSMGNEAERVQAHMNDFAARILAEGIDPRVVVITSSEYVRVPDPLGSDATHFRFIDDHVGSNAPLEKLIEHYAAYADFLRPEAVTHFVAVTDDESDLPADGFDSTMSAHFMRPYTFHAIASPDVMGHECDGAAAVGRQYYDLAGRTGGQRISICTDDWTAVFDTLVTAIVEAAPLPCNFALPDPPDGMTLDPRRVNVIYTASDGTSQALRYVGGADSCGASGWYYDDPTAPSEIRLCEGTCAIVGADTMGRIDVALGCETLLL